MGELVDTLVGRLTGELRPGCQVVGLRAKAPGFEVTLDAPQNRTFETDAIVLAVPAFVAAGLLEAIEPQLAGMLAEIRYVSTATISLGYRFDEIKDQHNFNGFGFVIPKHEDRKILACTWSSTKFSHRAPEGNVLLRAFVGGDRQGQLVSLPDDDLIEMVKSEIADIMGVTANPIVCKIYRWVDGNPQYDVGHLDRVSEIEALGHTIPGLYLTGSAFRGIGIPDCVNGAKTTVDRLIADLS